MKKLLVIVVFLVLLVAGCGNANKSSPGEEATGPTGPSGPETTQPDLLAGLVKDEYSGIQIHAVVLERKALLSGLPVPVTVVVENTGDKTVSYVQGSGSFTTPQAIFLESEGLQIVLPEDQLGVMTMDFVALELKPGENIQFKLYVMATLPNEKFDLYTNELFNEQLYIVDMDWTELNKRYPDIVAAPPGNYTVCAYFIYTAPGEDGQIDIFGEATGYAQAECEISIN